MKKHLFLFILTLAVLSVSNVWATSVKHFDLSSSNAGWSSTYNTSTHVATIDGWGAWGIQVDSEGDFSDYAKLTVEFESIPGAILLQVQQGSGWSEENLADASSGTSITGDLSDSWKSDVKKILIKNNSSSQITITITDVYIAPACTAPSSVTITGTNKYLAGQTISLTATPSGGSGTATYQWQKEINSVWTNINNGSGVSGATTNNLQITSCDHNNSGQYRCVVSTGATCSTNSDTYGVHVFSIHGAYYGGEYSDHEIVWSSGTTGTATIHLNASSIYMFKVWSNDGYYYGNGDGNYIVQPVNWDCGTGNSEMRLMTGPEGDYTFTVDIENGLDGSPYVNLQVNYPSVTHPSTGYIYLSKWWDCYVHYWYNNDNVLSKWGYDPQISTYTNICGTDYWYFPVVGYYCNFIAKDKAGDPSNTTGDQYLGEGGSNGGKLMTHNGTGWVWQTFTTYTISFAAGDGSGSMSSITGICPSSDQAITANSFTAPTGYEFSHWTANVDVTINSATVTAGSAIADEATLEGISGNIALTAYWSPITYTITLDKGDHGAANKSATVAYDATSLTSFTAVTATGYNCTGYYDGSTKVLNIDGSFAGSNVTDYITSSKWSKADNCTLTAKWTPKTTTISIDANTTYHGSTTPGTVTATWGQELPDFTAASGASGYGLKGYYTAATAGTKIINSDGTLVRNTTYATDEDTPKWKYEGATETFYAQYDPVYTVTVDDDGNGTGEADKAAYFAGETVTITAKPSSGYIFDEWTTSDGVTFVSSTSSTTTFNMPSKAVTVTANFELNPCTDSKTIQCETDRIIPTTGTSAPSELKIITSSHHYSGYHGDGYCDFKGSDGELYYLFRAPSSTYNFTVYLTNVDNAYMNIYTTNSAEKCDATTITYGGTTYYKKSYHALDGPTGDNPIGYRTVSSVSLNGTYIIGLYGKNWTVYDQVVIEASTDVFCQYTVSATATNGSVSGIGTYYEGETVSLTPSANPGYEFTGWSSLSGVTVSGYEDDNPLTFTMPGNAVSVTASFETSCTPHDITLTNDGHGSATASPTSACNGDAVTITPSPNTGYHFHYWSTSDVTITGHEYDNPLSITMPDKDISVAAHFLRSIIATGNTNLGSTDGYYDSQDGTTIATSNVDDPEGKFNHKVLQVDYKFSSTSSYWGISLPVDNGYTTSIASDKAGLGFWYRTESSTDKVLMYFCVSSNADADQFEALLPATNGEWQYWYIATDKVDDNTTFGFYINGSKYGKSSGTINANAKFWLSEVEPLTPADVTVLGNETIKIAPVVEDLVIYQGGEVTNSEDVIVTGSIAYHRHAEGGALTNKLDQWYTFAVPFTLSGIEVYDTDGNWYDINAVYYSDNEADQSATNPNGKGHFYLQYLEDDDKNQMTNDRWRYVNPGHSLACVSEWEENDGTRFGYPKKDYPYIILFDDDKPEELPENYWASNPDIRFVGGPQTIASTAWTPDYDVKETEYWMYANNTLHSITLTNDAYILNEDGTMFVLEDKPTIRPFECYIQATEEFKLTYASIPMRHQGGDTPTAIEDIELNDTSRTIKVLRQGHLIIIRNGQSYNLMGARVR